MRALLYPPIKLVGRITLKMFFRQLARRGAEHIPRSGPVVLVANHPNMLLDAMVLGVTSPRTVRFLAKSTLFSGLLGLFLRGAGLLPVYRPADNHPTQHNEGTFEACYELLEAGGVIGLFPEGTSHSELRMLHFKTGAARIALGAAARCSDPVRILPCGIWYTDKHRWWSDCLVVYGPPIEVPPSAVGPEDREAVLALTAAAEDSLRALLVELDDAEQARILKLVEALYRPRLEGAALEQRWAFAQTVVEGYRVFGQEDPQRVASLVAELEEYDAMLEHLGLRPSETPWAESGRFTSLLRLGVNLLGLALYLAPALMGLVLNIVPWKLPALAGKRASGSEEIATFKFLAGLACFVLWYAGLSVAGYLAVGPWGVTAGLAAPLLGRFTVRYVRHLSRFVRGVRVYSRLAMGSQLAQVLAERQASLIEQLDRLGEQLDGGASTKLRAADA